ncbi:MAG TPA: ABC transporter substrate-binding protein [Stellaceae bacterium]|nr:ABC transporter substrate-binding protein [Stellaceae bacterium]
MRPYRFLFLAAAALAGMLALATPAGRALAADDAASFVGHAADSVLALARDKDLSQDEFKQRLRTIADEDFDVPRIARFALGRYWRTTSDTDRQQFVEAFEDYMVQVYATHFRQFSGANFKVVGQRQQGDTTVVTTEIAQATGQPPAKFIWQVARQPNGYKITDVAIEGISQAITYREEFSSVIGQHGGQVSALTQQLREKAKG